MSRNYQNCEQRMGARSRLARRASDSSASAPPRATAYNSYSWLFDTPDDILDALSVMPIYYQARSVSLMRIRRQGRNPYAEPFGPGFLATIEVRTELARLLNLLDERSRALLVMWLIEDHPVTSTALQLGVSRGHCYRLRDKALRTMLDEHWAYRSSDVRRSQESVDR